MRHSKTGREEDVTLTRQKISYNPVSTKLCGAVGSAVGPKGADSKLGYIRVATFNKQTSDSFRQALDKLKADGAGRWGHVSALRPWQGLVQTDSMAPL